MHKIEITKKNLVRECPSEIHEMDQKQFVRFIGDVLQYISGQLTIGELRIRMVISLLRIRYNFLFRFMSQEEKENVFGEIFRMSETLCEGFFEEIEQEGQMVKSFKLSVTKNFIPKICGKYYGPQDALQDISFAEYRIAHSCYADYLKSKSEKDLNRLIAVLYRPAKSFLWLRKLLPSFDGQVRVPITAKSNPLFLEKRVKDIARLPLAVRYGIFLFFSGSEEFLAKGSINLDGKEIDFTVIYEKSDDDTPDSPDIGLVGILYSLAETKVFGSIEETDGQNLYDIMIRLYQVVMQGKAMEAKMKTNG